MSKILLFVLVFAFWGLFYLGTKNPGLGETITFFIVVFLVLLLLSGFKSFLFKKTSKNK